MPRFEVEADGRRFEVEAPNMGKAQGMARLYIARNRMTKQAEAGAQERSAAWREPEAMSPLVEAAYAGMSGEGGAFVDPNATVGDIGSRAASMASVAALAPLAAGAIAAPVAAGKALIGGLAGSTLGQEGGQWVGRRVPVVGGETLGKVLGTAGGVVGGGAGAVAAPRLGLGKLLQMASGGRLGALLGGAEAQAARSAATEIPKALEKRLAAKAVDQELKRQALEQRARALAFKEAREARLVGRTAGPAATPAATPAVAAPAATVAAAPAAAMTEAEQIAAQLIKWKEAGLSGGQMVSSLQQVYGISPKVGGPMVKLLTQPAPVAAAKEAAKTAVSGLQAPRVEIGAQNVGRAVGMTKEQVRKAAGPVLGEALGEASPILPKQALKSIIDTMKAMPMAEREAYVARATSGKAQWQIENIRRTLEHLGLLLPVGAAAAAAKE